MMKEVLITGGAGFIGSHLCDELLRKGYNVKVLDNLSEQVHGRDRQRPEYLDPSVELIIGDVRDAEAVGKALENTDIVYHFAAKVGVGQSMYEIAGYTDVNNTGTAVLLEALIKKPVEKLIVASSMSVYGEGLYKKTDGEIIPGFERKLDDLRQGKWELYDEKNNVLHPVPTNEEKAASLSSVYALSKFDQERLCLLTGRSYGIPVTALRFFNVYGTRQALSNPYTGVLAIFASRLLNGNKPLVYEDGNQKRDFVNVKDVARACVLACERSETNGEVINIGSGKAYPIVEIAGRLASVMNMPELKPVITSNYRAGDIRHCYSDISKAKHLLGYSPEVDLETGLKELTDWLSRQQAVDGFETAGRELESRGLIVK
ncbi:MAG TPA: NAD-dependent epimerase/dehydratase family protein [Bacteroidales bacterium]|nr:NAD-dependent epimerase/dehydratase family protein [Bacteroidales bacterium]